jgi:hypothetical protein
MIDAKSSRLSAAIALARRGFRVFPAIENDKRPLIDKWPDRASSDTAEISAVWAEYPAGNIGCFNDDLISLDVDVKDGKQGRRSLPLLEMLYEALPPTYTQRSASGGWHYTFRAPREVVALIKTCSNGIAGFSGIDVRAGRTGYIIGAGSSTAAGGYTVESDLPIADAPQWLLDLLPKIHDRKTQPNGDRQTPLVPLDAETAIARAIDLAPRAGSRRRHRRRPDDVQSRRQVARIRCQPGGMLRTDVGVLERYQGISGMEPRRTRAESRQRLSLRPERAGHRIR